MIAANYFHDGYTQSGFIAAVPRMHGELRFTYRPALVEERSQLSEAARQLKPHLVRSPCRGLHRPETRRAGTWSMRIKSRCRSRAKNCCVCSLTSSSSCTRSWPVGSPQTSIRSGSGVSGRALDDELAAAFPAARSVTCARSATQKTADGGESAAVSSPAFAANLCELPHLDVRRLAPNRHSAGRARSPAAGESRRPCWKCPKQSPAQAAGYERDLEQSSARCVCTSRFAHGRPRAFRARSGRSAAGAAFGAGRPGGTRWELQQLARCFPSKVGKESDPCTSAPKNSSRAMLRSKLDDSTCRRWMQVRKSATQKFDAHDAGSFQRSCRTARS